MPYYPPPVTSSGVPDGDKGDVTVSGSGSTWTVDNDAITFAKMQNVTESRIVGRGQGSGNGDMQELDTVGLVISGTTIFSPGSLLALFYTNR